MIFKVIEDLSYVVLLRKKFNYLESIPGVLLPHPSSSAFPYKADGYSAADNWPYNTTLASPAMTAMTTDFYSQFSQPLKITPSMSSLEALLSKLPSVVPTLSPSSSIYGEAQVLSSQRPKELMEMDKVSKEERDDECGHGKEMCESSSSKSSSSHFYHDHNPYYQHHHYRHHLDVISSGLNKEI